MVLICVDYIFKGDGLNKINILEKSMSKSKMRRFSYLFYNCGWGGVMKF